MASGRLGSLMTVGAFSSAGLAGVLLSAVASAQPAKGGWLPPLPAGSASAAPAASAAKPPSGAAAAPSAPPGYLYEEQWAPPADAEPSAPQAAPQPVAPAPRYRQAPQTYRQAPPPGYYPYPPPPPGYQQEYVYEPPPPPVPQHRAPVNALWLGVRGGVLFPSGYLYDRGTDPYYAYGPGWNDVAGTGPLVELNVGGRFARRYIVFAAWEHAWLGTGGDSAYQMTFGSQTSARTDFAGVGFRWSSSPDDVGLALELGLGYRWFREKWENGYDLNMQGFGEFRFGIGADIRISRLLAISPMLMISEGVFNDRNVPWETLPTYAAVHQTVTLALGAHFDVLGGK